jgi:twinkle protein
MGRDKDGDHLFIMREGNRWACARNGILHPPYFEDLKENPLIEKSSSNKSFMQKFENNLTFPSQKRLTVTDVLKMSAGPIRDIPVDVVNRYMCKVEYDQCTGEQVRHFYPITSYGRIVTYKVRLLPKEFYNLHKNEELPEFLELFGTSTINVWPDHILIHEGQIDSMAGFFMLSVMKNIRLLRSLSLPNGNNLKVLRDNKEILSKARNLIYVPDTDDAGERVVPEIAKLIPHIKIMRLPEKDSELMLRNHRVDEYLQCFRRAQQYKPSYIVDTSIPSIRDMVLKPVEHGIPYPYPTLTKHTYGLTPRRLIGIGGGPGAGKTVFTQCLQQYLVYKHGLKQGIFSLEEHPASSLRRLAGHIMGTPIHLPGVTYNPAELERVLDSLAGRVFYYDHAGYKDWSDIVECMRYMSFEGVKVHWIDPLSALHAHLSSGDGNQFINSAMMHMARLIHEWGCTIFHVNHLNNPEKGKDHSEGGIVKPSQFAGSRGQWRFSTDIWGLVRDSMNPDPIIRNSLILMILKDRLSGAYGQVYLKYDTRICGLLEIPPSKHF